MDILKYVFIGLVVLFGLAIAFSTGSSVYDTLPPGAANAQDGFQLTQQIAISGGTTMQMVTELLFYVFIPFLLVFTLIWGTFQAGAGRFFSKNVNGMLAFLLSLTVMWSRAFLAVAAGLNAWGAVMVLLLGIAGIAMGSYATFHEWSGETRKAVKHAKADLEMEEEEKKIDNRILKRVEELREEEGTAISDKAITLAIEASETPLNDVSSLRSIHRDMPNHYNADKGLKKLVGRKKNLAKRLEKHMEEELREAERDLKYE